jgi:hypothetical protein
MRPFTDYALDLQGGHFDHADRIFTSIQRTYTNITTSMTDVKELLPEFYYNPHFLDNHNQLTLGQRQNGTLVGEVDLPPWANGSSQVFVEVMRAALESEYVSANLHHWIDLVFGFKQQGAAAVEATNVFFYLTYEGSVDLDAIGILDWIFFVSSCSFILIDTWHQQIQLRWSQSKPKLPTLVRLQLNYLRHRTALVKSTSIL